MSLIVTGTIGIDTIFTPDGGHADGVLGGSAIYFAAAASFFTPVRLVAAVGDDFPSAHRAVFEKFPKIDLEGLETRGGSKTFRWGGKYQENIDHRDTLFTELNVLGEAPPAIPASYKDSALVFLANTHPGVQLGMIDQLPKRRLTVADTMDLWIGSAPEELAQLLTRVDGLVLNYDEAEQLTGKRNTVSAGRHILEFGPRFVVIKKGEHGCIFVHRDGIAALPAYPAEHVVDPTGAGDSFAGGMMGAIATALHAGDDPSSYETIRRALAAGTVAASFTIESFSLDRLARLSRAEIDARLGEFAQMMHLA